MTKFGGVLRACRNQLEPAHLSANGFLQQLRSWQTALLHERIKVVRQIDLHSGHTPKYTPIELCRKLRPPNDSGVGVDLRRPQVARRPSDGRGRSGRGAEWPSTGAGSALVRSNAGLGRGGDTLPQEHHIWGGPSARTVKPLSVPPDVRYDYPAAAVREPPLQLGTDALALQRG
jgi:hypothetical protein